MTDQPTEMNDAKFREIVLRALDRMGEPSVGHVMVKLGRLETENQRLRWALDYIDGHDLGSPDAGKLAAAALRGEWESPRCCNGHGLDEP